MQSDIQKKKGNYQISIRKQALQKILGLRRIKPKLIHSDQEAITVLVDGLDILQKSSNDEQLIEAMKSMTDSFKKYDLQIHSKLIKDTIRNVKWLITDPLNKDIIKEAGMQLILVLCFVYPDLIAISDIPVELLEGLNLRLIRLTLMALHQLISNVEQLSYGPIRQIILNQKIFTRLLLVYGNFNNQKQCFDFIKVPFLCFTISFCFIAYHWNINKEQNDFKRLVECSINTLEKDIILEAQQDHTLRTYFEKFYRKFDHQNCFDEAHSLSYPFQLLGLTTKMIQQVNCDVFIVLNNCLDFQLQNNSVQKPLVACLISILKETTISFQDPLRRKIFKYIFSMDYAGKQNEGFIREIIILALNDSINYQEMNEEIFEAIRDLNHPQYPETCRLLEVMKYLQDRQDTFTQRFLMELIANYLTINGSTHYINECAWELSYFQEARKVLQSIGFDI